MHNNPIDELLSFLKQSDNYTQDSREWPDPTEPRAAQPPMPHGCTCHMGEKLNCPIHGLNAPPEVADIDHTWSMPENHPVGYEQDQPRNWTQAVSSFSGLRNVRDAQHDIVPSVGKLVEVKQSFVPFAPLQTVGGFGQSVDDNLDGLVSSQKDFKWVHDVLGQKDVSVEVDNGNDRWHHVKQTYANADEVEGGGDPQGPASDLTYAEDGNA